jgi:hypothetical protein
MNDPTWPSATLLTVSPSDATILQPPARQLYIGTAGDVSVTCISGATVVFKNCIAGSSIGPFFISKVNATSTTASNIVAFV